MYITLFKLIRNELILKIYETLWMMLLGFETPLDGGERLPISSYGLSVAWGFEIPNFLTNLDDKMGVLEVIGWDVPNFTKDVPNFVNDVPDFVKDVPRVPKCIPRWGLTPNHFLMGSNMKLSTISVRWESRQQLDQMYQILSRMYQGFQSVFWDGDRSPVTSLWVPNEIFYHSW